MKQRYKNESTPNKLSALSAPAYKMQSSCYVVSVGPTLLVHELIDRLLYGGAQRCVYGVDAAFSVVQVVFEHPFNVLFRGETDTVGNLVLRQNTADKHKGTNR